MRYAPDVLRPTRRQFMQGAALASAGLLAGCGPLPWQGSSQTRPPAWIPRIGYVTDLGSPPFDVFREAMRDLGYTEGQNIIYEYRDPERDLERTVEYTAELVRMPVDAIVAGTVPETRAAMQATKTIPIVMGAVPDPVGLGLVASLNRPGGNVTGPSSLLAQLTEKRLELLKETVPGLSRVGLIFERDRSAPEVARQAAEALGVRLLVLEVGSPEDFPGAFATALAENADGILSSPHPMIARNAHALVQAASSSRLPTMYETSAYVRAGGLMAYGVNITAVRRLGAWYVDRILKGAKPADLPVQQPREFEFVINLKTAQTLGLSIPHHVLLQATEVIE